MDKTILNLFICVPSRAEVHMQFALSLQTLVGALRQQPVQGYDGASVSILNEINSCIAKSRYQLARKALENGATHLLWVDTDQTFPPQLVHALARHKKPIVGCNIAIKTLPSAPTARAKSEDWFGGHKVYSKGKKGLERVWRIGFGVVLIEAEVFKKIPEPWFNIRWDLAKREFVGEDWFFCEQAEAAGIPIFVDHDASLRVGHIGNFEFTHNHIIPESESPKLEVVA